LKIAAENAKKEERQRFNQKGTKKWENSLFFSTEVYIFYHLNIGDPKTDLDSNALHKEVEELKRNTALYFKRFKKEKRVRRKLQEQLELETKRRQQVFTL